MAEGRSNTAIAEILMGSERSVEKHVGNIFSKLGLARSHADHRRVLGRVPLSTVLTGHTADTTRRKARADRARVVAR